MNKLFGTAIVLALAAAGPVSADDIAVDNSAVSSTRTRAEVRAELMQARSDGSARAWVDGDFLERAMQPATKQPRLAELPYVDDDGVEPVAAAPRLAQATRGAH